MRARPGIRTRTVQILSLLPLPVGLGGRWRAIHQRKETKNHTARHDTVPVPSVGLEPTLRGF